MSRFFTFIAVLLAAFATGSNAQQSRSQASSAPPCLSYGEAYNIALRWLQIFQTDLNGTGTGSAIIPSTLASNITVSHPLAIVLLCRFSNIINEAMARSLTIIIQYYDEGATFGKPDPVYNSSQAVTESVTGSGYSGALVTNVTYSIIEAFASCDTTVVRWQSDSLSANATNV